MRIHSKSYLLICVVAIFIFSSCTKKTNKQGKFIPKDAVVVAHVNGASLFSKVPWDSVKQNTLYKDTNFLHDVPDFMKQVLDNPDNSGVDIKSDVLFFVCKDSMGGYACMEGNLKDAAKFKEFNSKISQESTQSEKDGIQYITFAHAIVGWNKEKFIYVTDAQEMSLARYDYDAKPKQRDLMATCQSIFVLKEGNSLGQDEKFSELMQKEGDIHFWVNPEAMYKNMGDLSFVSTMFNFDKIYKGVRTATTINFENGKINVFNKYYAGKELSDVYKKYEGRSVNEDMLKRIPAKDVAGVFAMNYKPEGIKEILKVMNLDGALNMGMAFVGFNVDDFVKANKGDLLFAVSDIQLQKDSFLIDYEDSSKGFYSYTTPKPDVLFATSIGDKTSFDLMVNSIKKLGEEKFKGEVPKGTYYNLNDKYFVIGNNKDNADKYLTGSNNNFDFIKKLSGNPIAGYINFQYILKSMEEDATKDSSGKVVYDLSLKMWDNAYLTGGKYESGGLTQNFEINLIDKNKNSAQQLLNYFSQIAKTFVASKAVIYDEKEEADTLIDRTIPESEEDIVAPVPKKAK